MVTVLNSRSMVLIPYCPPLIFYGEEKPEMRSHSLLF